MLETWINRAATAIVRANAPTLTNRTGEQKAEAWRRSLGRLSFFSRVVPGVARREVPSPRGAWFIPEGAARSADRILFLHGGAFVSGGIASHQGYVSALAKRLGVPVFAADYRLAPEHRFPAGLEDCREAYEYVRGNAPSGAASAAHVTVAGDSAGGNLSLALFHVLQEMDETLPDAMLLISPLTDMTNSLPSWTQKASVDPMLGDEGMNGFTRQTYVPEGTPVEELRQPWLSPLNGDFHRAPPTLLFVGGRERLYDDAVYLARKLRRQGVDVEFYEETTLFHDWPIFLPALPAAFRALETTHRWYERIRGRHA